MELTIKGLRVHTDEQPVKPGSTKPPAVSQALNRKSIKAAQEEDPDKKKRLEQSISEA